VNSILAPLRVDGRVDRIRSALAARSGVDALIITDLINVRWATGFTGSNGWLIVGPDSETLVTDRRYGDQAVAQAEAAGAAVTVAVGASQSEMIALSVSALAGDGRIGVEAQHMTIAEHDRWRSVLDAETVALTGLVEEQRRTKDSAEIARIELAAVIAAQALSDCAHLLRLAIEEPVTERDVRDALERRMRELGADGPGYDTIVATGLVNGSRPHHRPDRTLLVAGDLVVIDVGAAIDGYRSDMTRTYVVGEPTQRHLDLFGLVAQAQAAGLAVVGPGVPCRDVDAACRDLLSAAGHADSFRHGTGHGVGLQIHEDPFMNASTGATLQVGDVVTVEPGVYREDFGGLRLEDLVVVTPDGHRNLTPLAKDSPCPPSPPTT
jgi:Xaa-Pro aminopeptidase